MKLIKTIINSNLYISLAAVFLTVETQVQVGMPPQWHPYLFIIFFATIFEYNIHRLVTVLTSQEALNSDKHEWVRTNLKKFYLLVFLSVAGFIGVLFLAKNAVLIALAPIAVITLFYSLPVFGNKQSIFRLREIPFVKIFLIAFVWATATLLLPIIQTEITFNKTDVFLIWLERFFFVFAITVPFDIRDMEADKKNELKTIPLAIGEEKSWAISYALLLAYLLISTVHYHDRSWLIWPAFISAATTFAFLYSRKIRSLPFYHYGILDGTMLLQGLLVLMFYWRYGVG